MLRLSIVLLLIFQLNLNADATHKFIFQFDNDLFYNVDEGYTNGVRVALMQEKKNKVPNENFLQRALHHLNRCAYEFSLGKRATPERSLTRYAWGTGLTQLMYTPKDRKAKVPPYGQRPYAGWLGLECSLNAKNDTTATSLTLSVGTTGENSFADKTQTWVHKTRGIPVFKGWESQVPQELTLNLHLDQKYKLPINHLAETYPLNLEGYSEWGIALGNFKTNAYIGMLLRAGINLTPSFSTPRVQIGSYAHDLFKIENPDRNHFSLYVYGGLRGTAVLHDISLNGPLFRDFKYKVENKALVGEAILGYGLSWRHFEISNSFTHRSREFKSQKTTSPFASILIRFDLPF